MSADRCKALKQSKLDKTLSLNNNLINFGIPLSLFGILILLMRTSFLEGNDTLILAITVDLLLTVPLVYFFLIRKSEIPRTTVIPVMVVGFLIGSYFLPKGDQYYLNIFKTWVLPLIEVSILTFVIIKVHTALKKYKSIKGFSPDFFSALKSTCYEILPKKLVMPFATEIAVIYYGFIDWRKLKIRENEFTHHKKSGTAVLFGLFIFMIGIETVAFHLLLARWNIVAAWVLTSLSIYTAIQIFGFARSLSKRPIVITDDSLNLKYGILNEAEIRLADIEHIELSRRPLDKAGLTQTLSPLGEFESHNVIIHLRKVNELIGVYGMRKKFRVIGMHIDNPKDFKEKIENAIQECK